METPPTTRHHRLIPGSAVWISVVVMVRFLSGRARSSQYILDSRLTEDGGIATALSGLLECITISYITVMDYKLSDAEFLHAFESCELSNESFHHRDHIRLAWIYLQRYPELEAREHMAGAIRRFAAHHGKSDKYHETVTVAWLRLVANGIARMPADASFEQLTAALPELLDKQTIEKFYSRDVLTSDVARTTYIEPDLQRLP
jgi:hypothetical protein